MPSSVKSVARLPGALGTQQKKHKLLSGVRESGALPEHCIRKLSERKQRSMQGPPEHQEAETNFVSGRGHSRRGQARDRWVKARRALPQRGEGRGEESWEIGAGSQRGG